MKTIKYILLLLPFIGMGQFTLEPAPGERHVYFLNQNSWDDTPKSNCKVYVNTFENKELFDEKLIWVSKAFITKDDFKDFLNYLWSTKEYGAGGFTTSDGEFIKFDVYLNNGRDMFELMHDIKQFFNPKTK